MAGSKKPARKPQITFQVSEPLKLLYELASEEAGLNVTRLCAAGLFWMVFDQAARGQALSGLAAFERNYLGEAGVRQFVADLPALRASVAGPSAQHQAGAADAAAAAQAGDEAQRGPQQSKRRTAGK